jgi:hypothetical protein
MKGVPVERIPLEAMSGVSATHLGRVQRLNQVNDGSRGVVVDLGPRCSGSTGAHWQIYMLMAMDPDDSEIGW